MPRTRSLLFLLPIVLLLFVSVLPAQAQFPSAGSADTTRANAAPQWPADSLGRRTPRGTVLGFIKAVGKENYDRAARYLNLKDLPRKVSADTGPMLAQALQRLLDQQGSIIPRALISNDTTGILNDDLSPNVDVIGTAQANGESFDILLERVTDPTGAPLWLFAAETVQRIPTLEEEADRFTIDKLLPRVLVDTKWHGVPVGHWLAMLVLSVLAYLLAGVVTLLLVSLLKLSWRKARTPQAAELIQAFVQPIRLYASVWLVVTISQLIGISIIIRQRFSDVTVVVGLIAFLLLLWRLIDVLAQYAKFWLIETGQLGRLSAVLFLRRTIKIVLVAFGIIAVLNVLGWDVTTGLAALGIGGIALALGAQKTIENLVGSITLIADQPIRVGDLCKVDDITGTVEQIGMRSTRLRTPNRTMVIVPNGQLASLKIENFAFRDRLLFKPKLQLRYETTADQIRYILTQLQAMLHEHPKINPDPARVRFIELGESSLNLEIFAYVDTADYNEFLLIQEELLLQMMAIIRDSGTGFAFPSQTLYMGKDTPLPEEKKREVEQKVRQWRDGEKPAPPEGP